MDGATRLARLGALGRRRLQEFACFIGDEQIWYKTRTKASVANVCPQVAIPRNMKVRLEIIGS
jgi:hypothetical protein